MLFTTLPHQGCGLWMLELYVFTCESAYDPPLHGASAAKCMQHSLTGLSNFVLFEYAHNYFMVGGISVQVDCNYSSFAKVIRIRISNMWDTSLNPKVRPMTLAASIHTVLDAF